MHEIHIASLEWRYPLPCDDSHSFEYQYICDIYRKHIDNTVMELIFVQSFIGLENEILRV